MRIVEPVETPVTKPELLTVAMPVAADSHGLLMAGEPEPVSWVVELMLVAKTPVIVGVDGTALIVTFNGEETHVAAFLAVKL